MKRVSIAGIGAIALIAAIPFAGNIPGLTALNHVGEAIAQTVNPAKVALRLMADKQVVQNEQGRQQVSWQQLQGSVQVLPGDVIRYRVQGENSSDRPARNLTINQAVPQRTTYLLNSATVVPNNGVNIVYSIDGGKSFVEKPTVQVKLPNGKLETRPAPAEAYTNIRWKFTQPVAANSKVNATYQVKVR